jgi:hypothetical protein
MDMIPAINPRKMTKKITDRLSAIVFFRRKHFFVMQSLADKVFDVKEKLTDGEYKEIMDTMKDINDNKGDKKKKKRFVGKVGIKRISKPAFMDPNPSPKKKIPSGGGVKKPHRFIQGLGYGRGKK